MSKQPDYVKRAKLKYRESTERFSFTVNPRTELLILEKLSQQPIKSSYIKSLIVRDINHDK